METDNCGCEVLYVGDYLMWMFTFVALDLIKEMPDEILLESGLRRFDKTLWLYPVKWFDFIPEGYPVVDIFKKRRLWNKKKMDDDHRDFCMAYGFVRGS